MTGMFTKMSTNQKFIDKQHFETHIYIFPSTNKHKMAPKRKYQEAETQEIVHESRQFQVPGSAPKPAAKKPRRTEPYEFKKQAHTSSVNSVKKRIRDITRRLERSEDLPADVRVQDERALATYQQELAAAEAEKLRQKMIKKYHMVRFFGILRSCFSIVCFC